MIELIFLVIVFFVGFGGVFLCRKNIILVLMALEIMLMSLNLMFLFFSLYFDDIVGFLFSFFILTLSAIEVAIGLSLTMVLYFFENDFSFID